jgi:two-component system chemotaxis response regulator CheB
MQRRDVIVVGASAGGVEALAELAKGLPADLPAAVFVVLHLPSDARSFLPGILSRAGPLPAVHARDGAPILSGHIYIAPPNRHLELVGSAMRLPVGPRVNGVRPSIDVLFRSAARTFGERVVGVILSGTHNDGSLGVDAIRLRGGVVVVQDPEEARFSGMPRSALARVEADYVLPVAEISALLADMPGADAPVPPVVGGMSSVDRDVPSGLSAEDATSTFDQKSYGAASGLTCPDCHGSVWEVTDEGATRIECRVGHAFSIDAFLDGQAVALEDALWAAINSLEECAATLQRFATKFARSTRTRQDYEQRAEIALRQASVLRDGLTRVITTQESATLETDRPLQSEEPV